MNQYGTDYYRSGYQPSDRGSCTELIPQALLDIGYDVKAKINTNMYEGIS